jgi:formylglycine-generating enzyme
MFHSSPDPKWLGFSFWLGLFVVATLNLFPASAAADDKPAKELPKTMTVTLGGDVKMEFVLIPKGKFKMGSPPDEKGRGDDEVLHNVEISKPFYLAKYPVTQKQYQTLTKTNPSFFQADQGGADKVKDLDTDQFPVETVSWNDAQAFCKKLMENDPQQRNFRLPTEAEWEFACRAGTTTPFSFGSKLNGKEANCNGNYPYGSTEKGPNKGRTTKVSEYGENPWGLCDMHGNVWQWCEDYYGPYNETLKATDPLRSVKQEEDRRILRGGSWLYLAGQCRAAYRNWDEPGKRQNNIGFRVAFRPD